MFCQHFAQMVLRSLNLNKTLDSVRIGIGVVNPH